MLTVWSCSETADLPGRVKIGFTKAILRIFPKIRMLWLTKLKIALIYNWEAPK